MSQQPREVNRFLVIAVAVLAVSAVVAGVVIYSGGGGTTGRPTKASAEVDGNVLVIGPQKAPHHVVVVEDLADPLSRQLDLASRDFLQADAAAGRVQVRYQPELRLRSAYATQAWSSWTQAAAKGDGARLLALHRKLYDEQPTTTGGRAPEVTLDGRAVTGRTVQDVAQTLERTLARG